MMTKTTPTSYPYYFLKETIHTIGLLLTISENFTDKEDDNWEYSIFHKIDNKIYSDILLKETPLSETLRVGIIKFSIITFTASVERYIKEIIELSLRRSSSLRKKAFNNHEKISPEILEKHQSLNSIKKELFNQIVVIESKGKLLSEKLKKVEAFLSQKNNIPDLLEALDQIWKIRNDIAHSNKKEFNYKIKYKENIIEINVLPNRETNLILFNLMTDFICFLEQWEDNILSKWKVDDFIE